MGLKYEVSGRFEVWGESEETVDRKQEAHDWACAGKGESTHLPEHAGILAGEVEKGTTRCQGGAEGRLVRASADRGPRMTAHTLYMYEPTIRGPR